MDRGWEMRNTLTVSVSVQKHVWDEVVWGGTSKGHNNVPLIVCHEALGVDGGTATPTLAVEDFKMLDSEATGGSEPPVNIHVLFLVTQHGALHQHAAQTPGTATGRHP